MSALTLTLKEEPRQRVDMSPLSAARELTPAEIAALRLWAGKRRWRVDELFTLEGEDTARLVLRGDCRKLDYIGRDARDLDITVEGNAGAYAGMGMRSGRLHVKGDVDLFAACELRGGLGQIDGNAGDFLGAALPGDKRGMRGGIVLVKGDAGDRCGDQLRRGIILVEGNAGAYCGSRLIAGTIAVMGQVGENPGYGLRRGTLLLWRQPAAVPPTYGDCGTHTLGFLPLWFAGLRHLDSRFADPANAFNRVRRYGGDLASVGRGEILVRAA
ncbi:formylmethanofuran dehydrogenase subunit C [Methylomarinovum caldicuralii]|uniref:Formylmethanofuran dehydrogenase subunit C n=1 Tax=Methylomarinovum caldicuralii TaxID=438856 RepID=A0AAU9C3R6_9GAMM|nr:formylmethanofuran dehydrogenase subunit C [Methylomarinovum caldicuralii]BCX82333.1 formylmethanofuran dehydrogenase subunit C [Methylomarinovum caldicuralii]